MKIISWNCNCKFREKFKEIKKINADIYIIQECENPELSSSLEYKEFASNYLWIGDNKNKGLGIFAKDNIKLDKLNWKSYCLRCFLPVRVNNLFNILGVWACAPYIEEYYIYQNINIDKYNLDTIIMGDFNSNKIWDKEHGNRNHINVVNELKIIGLESAYHYISNEEQGKEQKATFCLYRHEEKKYHIDHCFCNPKIIEDYNVMDDIKWLKLSDHFPIVLEIKEEDIHFLDTNLDTFC